MGIHNVRYKAKVIRVFDGDTIEIEIKKGSKKTIRFFGVDAPERKQDFGKEATERIKNLIDKKEIEVYPVELGIYGREVGIVYLNGVSLSEVLLKEGLAFASGYNHKLATKYYRLQENSRVNKIGMWKQGFIESPAAFRKRNKSLFKKTFDNVKTTRSSKPKKENIKPIQNKVIKEKENSKGLLQHLKEIISKVIKEDELISVSEILKKVGGKNVVNDNKEEELMSVSEILKKVRKGPKV